MQLCSRLQLFLYFFCFLSGDRWRHQRPLLFPCGFCIAFSPELWTSGIASKDLFTYLAMLDYKTLRQLPLSLLIEGRYRCTDNIFFCSHMRDRYLLCPKALTHKSFRMARARSYNRSPNNSSCSDCVEEFHLIRVMYEALAP